MAKKILTNVDMCGNVVSNPVLNPLAVAPDHAPPYYYYTSTATADKGTLYKNVGTYEAPVWEAAGRAPTAGDGIQVDGYEVSLPEPFYDYLVKQTFKTPVISAFAITGLGGAAEIGTSVNVSGFSHTETNITNISGKLTLRHGSTPIKTDIAPSATSASGTFSEITVTRATAGNETFTLSGTDALGQTVTKSATKSFYIPKFLGSNANDSVTATEILGMSKAQNQPTSITLGSTQYIYFVTNGTINTVKDSATGFGVPIEAAITQTVSINGVNVSYKVYRTSARINAGKYTFTIS